MESGSLSQWCFTHPPQSNPSAQVTDPFAAIPSKIKFFQAGDLWKEEPHTYLQIPKSFCTWRFCQHHNSWCYHRTAKICVGDSEDSCSVTSVTAISTETVSQPNLAHWGVWGTRAGVWQPAPGRVHVPFYTLSHSCTSGRKSYSDRSRLPVQERFRDRTGWLAETEIFKAVFLWYFMWLWWKNQWPLQCC